MSVALVALVVPEERRQQVERAVMVVSTKPRVRPTEVMSRAFHSRVATTARAVAVAEVPRLTTPTMEALVGAAVRPLSEVPAPRSSRFVVWRQRPLALPIPVVVAEAAAIPMVVRPQVKRAAAA